MRGLGRAVCALATIAALASPARAAPPCGTVVIPGGLGITPPQPVTGINPIIGSSEYSAEIENIIYRPLIWVAADGSIDTQLSIAQSIDVSPDGLTYHVTMKPWVWSDGVPITADDVAYDLELIRTEGDIYSGKGQAGMPDIIATLTVTGPRAFDVVLTHKVGRQGFILNGLAQLEPLPRHAWGKTTIDEMWRRQTDPSFFKVVDGPYRVTRYAVGRYLVLRPNAAYSGDQKPQVDKIVVDFLEGVDPLRALQAGEADAIDVPPTVWRPATRLPGFRTVSPHPGYSFGYVGLNLKNPAVGFFRDVRVRQAIADALDQKLVISLVLHGKGIPMYSPTTLPQFMSPAARAGNWPVGYDPAKSRALLEAAGWKLGPDGVRVKDGKRMSFDFLLPSGSDAVVQEVEIAQQNLAAVGIQVNVSELTFTQLFALIYGPANGWQSYAAGWSQSPWPDILPLFGTGGGENKVGYSDPHMDALGKRIDLEDGPDAAQEFTDYAAEQQPVIFIAKPITTLLVRDGVEGLRNMLFPTGNWAPEFLHLSGPLACHAEAHRAS